MAIARALANAARIILTDEPTGNLDSRNAQVAFYIFSKIAHHDGCTRLDDLIIARALHLIAIVHWIGGVGLVTTVLLPGIIRLSEPSRRLAMFEEIEGRFSLHAKFSVSVAGLTGFYMTARLDAWHRFSDPQFWWMHAMVLVWGLFTLILFIGEPLFLHEWFRRRAARDSESAFALLLRGHWALLILSVLTIAGALMASHGMMLYPTRELTLKGAISVAQQHQAHVEVLHVRPDLGMTAAVYAEMTKRLA